jgi:hypothetical protein
VCQAQRRKTIARFEVAILCCCGVAELVMLESLGAV